ncbi:UDP-2,4-diacetamido-2,4,6-trideoxy-beta-L-altropyranose hydrolase [uncultured Nitratireductor sp.]|uniref:UDP-2,4-diacetamido-2,4, 6-trideoxy-beta-L-altropyranose hydrolase n=1 Tax=uncultured Nitratireductor sp. TaxID=520953 RepID=UPI0025D73D72|nr:UDP-2,4-diacetamido-2,4,6-trideoxy-beta-L-altropyranose hydrolase [uncultured Nitratireductor sp.]
MKLAFRVDASVEIGLGHAMRCLALADEAQRAGFRSVFLHRQMPSKIRNQLAEHGHETIALPEAAPTGATGYASWLRVDQKTDADDVVRALEAFGGADWLVCDHYGIDAEWEAVVRRQVEHIAVIDDLANRPHLCSVVIDTNGYDDFETRYDGLIPAQAARLLGPEYAILRGEFRHLRAQPAPQREEGSLLVSIGGADLPNYTRNVLNALDRLPAFNQVDVVIGAVHPDIEGIRAKCAAHGYRLHVQTPRLAELMLQASMSVGAGGTSTAERMCLGLPSLVLVVAENQRQLVAEAGRRGDIFAPDIAPDNEAQIAQSVERLRTDPSLRHHLAKRGQALVDGLGASRIVEALKTSRKDVGA